MLFRSLESTRGRSRRGDAPKSPSRGAQSELPRARLSPDLRKLRSIDLMRLIVGLGNPGKEYEQARHNAGFMAVTYLAASLGGFTEWHLENKFKSLLCVGKFKGELVMFILPQTFMNSSGEAVALVVNFYKISAGAVLVIHDDLDLPLGSFKLQRGVGPKSHNGILSVEASLGTKDFWRLRIGVDGRFGNASMVAGEEYVLGRFTADELAILTTLQPQIIRKINFFLGSGD